MKVKELSPGQVVAAATSRANAGTGVKEQSAASPADKVTVPTAQDRAAVEVVRQATASGRAARVQEIVNAVKSGQYYPSPQQIAQQLVSEAEIDARLAAMLKG